MANKDYAGKSAYFGDVAARYEERRTEEAVWQQEQDFVRAWAERIQPGSVVLDIPTGTGRFVELLLARHTRVLAWDISEDMLAQVRRRFPEGVPAALELSVGDAEHLSLADGAVDHIVCWRLFHLMPPAVLSAVLREFARVCRGSIVLQVFAVRPKDWRPTLWQRMKGRLGGLRRRLGAAGREQAWAHIPSFSHPEEELVASFDAAGLAVSEAVTLGEQNGLLNRVYTLARRSGTRT